MSQAERFLTHAVENQTPPLRGFDQAASLVRGADNAVGDAFCESRLGAGRGLDFGTLSRTVSFEPLIERAWPSQEATSPSAADSLEHSQRGSTSFPPS